MEKIRVLIADDHPLFRKGVQAALSTDARLEIVGEATSGQDAIAMATSLQPDVILMDIQLGGINGIEATRQILRNSPHIQILALTMLSNEDTSREREILQLIAQGQNNTQIADRLDLAPKTVRNHVSNIFNKLQVADRAQAIIRAREAGLK